MDVAPADWSTDSAAATAPTNDQSGSSDTPSTGNSPGPITKAGLRDRLRDGVRLATGWLEKTADELEAARGLWHADDDDVENIVRPASNLLWRRLPEDARGGDPIDVLFLALGVGGYVVRNVQLKQKLRRARLLAEQGGGDVAEGALG